MAGKKVTTAREIDTVQPGSYSAAPNLILRVKPTGARSWVFRYQAGGKVKEIGLGKAGTKERGLGEARELAEEMRRAIRNGDDPATILKPKHDPKAMTFKVYAEQYITANEAGWRNPKHRQQWRTTILGSEAYAKPLWHMRPGEISVGDVQKLLMTVWANKTETASRVRQRIETIIDYAYVIEGIDRRNPARWKGNLDKLLPNPRKIAKANGKLKPHAAPPWQEVPAIMAKLRLKPDVVSALALRFSILTFARSTEVRAGTWDEIDLDNAVWTIPGDRTKNEESHSVPLNSEALTILNVMAERKHSRTNRIFPGASGGLLSDVAINKVLHAAMPGITAHGIARSSSRDWVADATSFSDKVAEAALNHKNPNETEAAYLRTKFFDRRVELMKAWGEFLAGKENVIKLAVTS
jgi:integrase